jgi:1,4-dihydroxy-2-naphthoate octaprenyltransferase
VLIFKLIRASRPVTLTASIVPVIVGTVIANNYVSSIDVTFIFLILFSAIFLQIASNYFNDSIDFIKGADTSERLGPQRLSSTGNINPNTLLKAGSFCLIIALILGIPLVIKSGLPIFLIGVSSIFFAYLYTGGPKPLAYLGLGEVFAFLYFGVLAVSGTTFILTDNWVFESFIKGTQVGAFATALIGVNNFRDINQDIVANKFTLAARFGQTFQKNLVILFLILPLIVEAFSLIFGLHIKNSFFTFYFLLLNLSIVIKFFSAKPSKECNKFLGLISLAEILFCLGVFLDY